MLRPSRFATREPLAATQTADIEALLGAGADGDRVVSAGWLAAGRGPIPYLRAELPLESDECFLYDAHTIPEMRRMGVARARKSFLLPLCRESGFRSALCAVAIENRAALASVRESGFQAVGTYGWWRVPGRPRWRRAIGDRPLPQLVPTP